MAYRKIIQNTNMKKDLIILLKILREARFQNDFSLPKSMGEKYG
ncbi:MAG: hypothetical protein ABIH48_02460 [Candidatus Falkowbacteria bacterium]